MQSIALVIHVALAIGVIGLVLIQHGKGADAGAAFGSGASSTVFGSRGSASFLTQLTTALVGLFFLTSITLFYLAAHREGGISSVTELPGIVDTVPEDSVVAPSDIPTDVPTGEAAPAAAADSDIPEAPAADNAEAPKE